MREREGHVGDWKARGRGADGFSSSNTRWSSNSRSGRVSHLLALDDPHDLPLLDPLAHQWPTVQFHADARVQRSHDHDRHKVDEDEDSRVISAPVAVAVVAAVVK